MLFKKQARKEDASISSHPTIPSREGPVIEDGTETDLNDDSKVEGLAPIKSTATGDIKYPSGLKLALLMVSTFLSMFLVALASIIIIIIIGLHINKPPLKSVA